MNYYIDDRKISLRDLQARLEATDLIPSHKPLLEGISDKRALLEKAGIDSVATLRARLKSKKAIGTLADISGLDGNYLNLLRRVVEGFFPKPRPLKEFNWLDLKAITTIEDAGIKNTMQFFKNLEKPGKIPPISKEIKSELTSLANLCRIQWVSPNFARALIKAGYDSAQKISKADANILFEEVVRVNESSQFFKGKVGLRDISRVVVAAGYVPF